MSESGDNKVIDNFRRLIDECSADPNYNPANNKHKIPALETQYAAGDAAVTGVAVARAPNKLAVTDRETAFRTLRPLAVRSRNYLKASGASTGEVEDADIYIVKLSGGRKSAKLKNDPATPQNESTPGSGGGAGSGSASQMSYPNQIGHFESYIELVRNISAYTPNEADLKVAALTAFAASLTARNNAVSTTEATLNQARGQRDQLLYLNDDSIVNTALLVKAYVKAALGTQSQLFKQIRGLKFVKAAK